MLSNGIAHRDIKLENLLLTEEGHVKISDFGVSEVFCGIHPGLREAHGECGIGMKDVRLCQPGICGSMPYISPEVLAKKNDYDPRTLDVWSCAIVMITLACRGNPWQAAQPSDMNYMNFVSAWDKFLKNHPDGLITDFAMPKCGPIFSLISQYYSPGLRRLLLAMLHPNPEKRVSINDVLNDKYFRTIECCSPESNEDETVMIDAAGKGSTKKACKMSVQKVHHHAPPERKILPQHRFNMGDGYS
ncbi:hypothetical protein KEM56_000259 [Ascosphaera pollenicola]|nr:hypothetical protein KEM56_000259 [Ascosphaera pollenicola]